METLATENATLDLLKAYRPLWSVIRERRRNTAPITDYGVPSGDHAIETEWQDVAEQMDGLLEEHFAQRLGAVALAGLEHEQIISEHADLVAENGKGCN